MELETFNNEGVDQSTESVDNSFASFSEAGVGVDEEASVDVSIDEESNKRWAVFQITALNIYELFIMS